MTDQEKHDEKVVKKMLNSTVGDSLMRWLKRTCQFDQPVFSPDDVNGHEARLRDGGRHLVIKVNELKSHE